MSDFKKVFHCESGQAIVEFAMVLPVFILIVLGIIEFGVLFNAQLTINNDCREGARYASINSGEVDLASKIINDLCMKPLSSDVNVDVGFSYKNSIQYVTVIVTTDVKAITPLGYLLYGSGMKTISSELTVRVE